MSTIELFDDKYPTFNPHYVSQGNIGDCWLISVLFCLSNNEKGKKILSDCFYINNDGTYTIKLLDEKRKNNYVKIPCKFKINRETNQLKYSGSSLNIPELFNNNPSNEYIWASIFEKAISKYMGCMRKLDGNYAYNAFKLLSNNNVELIYGYGINNRFLDRIYDLFKSGKIICVVELSNSNLEILTNTNLVTNHAYSLYDIDKQDDNYIWYLFNPHNQYIDKNSCSKLDIKKLKDFVSLITYLNL